MSKGWWWPGEGQGSYLGGNMRRAEAALQVPWAMLPCGSLGWCPAYHLRQAVGCTVLWYSAPIGRSIWQRRTVRSVSNLLGLRCLESGAIQVETSRKLLDCVGPTPRAEGWAEDWYVRVITYLGAERITSLKNSAQSEERAPPRDTATYPPVPATCLECSMSKVSCVVATYPWRLSFLLANEANNHVTVPLPPPPGDALLALNEHGSMIHPALPALPSVALDCLQSCILFQKAHLHYPWHSHQKLVYLDNPYSFFKTCSSAPFHFRSSPLHLQPHTTTCRQTYLVIFPLTSRSASPGLHSNARGAVGLCRATARGMFICLQVALAASRPEGIQDGVWARL